MESRSGGLRARQRLRADPGERGIGRALPTSLGDDDDCAVGGDCREAGRPCIRCLSPASTCRGVFERSLRAAANCAELCGAVPVRCGTGKCDYCCGSATWLRAGDCAAVHSDGGPGAGCGDVCCDGACVLRFRCWFAHYPCSELRKPCITPTKLPNKRLTYTALWAPPGVDHCATWLEPTALLLLMRRYGYPMRVIETVLSQYTPPSYLILYLKVFESESCRQGWPTL